MYNKTDKNSLDTVQLSRFLHYKTQTFLHSSIFEIDINYVNKLHATNNVQSQSFPQLTSSHATAKGILKALLRNSVAKCRSYGSQCSTEHLVWAGRLKILVPNSFNPLNAELNPICHLLVLLGAHPILHISRIRVNIYSLPRKQNSSPYTVNTCSDCSVLQPFLLSTNGSRGWGKVCWTFSPSISNSCCITNAPDGTDLSYGAVLSFTALFKQNSWVAGRQYASAQVQKAG
jgi:hypothetical protein